MPTREQLLTKTRDYSASEIAQAINDKTITMYELSKTGKLTPLMRKRIEEMLSGNTVETIVAGPVSSPVSEKPELRTPETRVSSERREHPINTEIAGNGGSNKTVRQKNERKRMFRHPFSFRGRIRRLEYGLSYLIAYVYYIVCGAFLGIGLDKNDDVILCIVLASLIPSYWFIWAQGAKRCHDRDNSGWYQLIPFYFFVMIFGEGDKTENRFGDTPKE